MRDSTKANSISYDEFAGSSSALVAISVSTSAAPFLKQSCRTRRCATLQCCPIADQKTVRSRGYLRGERQHNEPDPRTQYLRGCISFCPSVRRMHRFFPQFTEQTVDTGEPHYRSPIPKLSSIDRARNVSVFIGCGFQYSQPQPHVSASRPQTSAGNVGPGGWLAVAQLVFRSTVTIMVASVAVSISEVFPSCP